MGAITRGHANLIGSGGKLNADGLDLTDDYAFTGTVSGTPISPSFKNKIINGDISVSQRGTSFSDVASGDYTIDRWKMNYRAIGNANIAQVDNKTYKSLKVTNGNASTQEIVMGTRIEDVTQFSNEGFVLSFFAKASTSCTLDTRVFENYGSGGSTTVTRVASGSQNKTITTSRQRFSITFTPSDMSSLTIGTSNFLEINFSVSLAASANWEYDSVQLEKGTTASDFEFIPFDVQLQRCQRYYYSVGGVNNTYKRISTNITNPNNRNQTAGLHFLPVPMRNTPTVTLPSASSINGVYIGGANTFSSVSISNQSEAASDADFSILRVSGTLGSNVGNHAVQVELTYGSTDKMEVSAEL